MDVKRAKVRLQDDALSMADVADGMVGAGATPLQVYALVTHALRGAVEEHAESFDDLADRALDICAGPEDAPAGDDGLLDTLEDMGQLKRRAQDHANVLMRMSQERRGGDGQGTAFREAYAFRALQGLFLYMEKDWEDPARPREVLVKVLDAASIALGSEQAVQASIVAALRAQS